MASQRAGLDRVVIGASAGGIEALSQLVAKLPADLPAAVFVVLHVAAGTPSALPAILRRRGPLPAAHPDHGEEIRPGRVYVAPPDHHLLIENDQVLLGRGPRENRVRPAIDVLFRSAALGYGPRVIGVVLTGYLDDGAAGLLAIKQRGGLAIVQDPQDAACSAMPLAALAAVTPDHVVPISEMGALLAELVGMPVPQVDPPERAPALTRAEVASSEVLDPGPSRMSVAAGAATGVACPDCGGGLFELNEGRLGRFRCYLGHAYSPESLLSAQRDEMERSLWVALRLLEERASILQSLAQRVSEIGNVRLADQYVTRAAALRDHASRLHELLK